MPQFDEEGFNNMQSSDVEEVLNSHDCEVTENELLELSEIKQILQVMPQFDEEGFNNMQSSDVEEVLNSHDCEVTENELLELLEDQSSDEHDNEETATTMTKFLTLSDLNKIISTAQHLEDLVFQMDPSLERSLKFKNGLGGLLLRYKEI
ncbi:hypothetical protein QE152_g13158 [Popillia japonica]|uniref:Uncharacterized protein n=1 Tax=Popillia japonica TaxID=7064 RepID=A0AAW1LEQ7_POPJA